MIHKIIKFSMLALVMFACWVSSVYASERVLNLVVAHKTVHFAGKPVTAIAVNNQIPAPTLHFKEGDSVTLNVYNNLNEETAIHWHGLIVPWQMDGVQGVTQKGIPSGGVFHYQFTLHQSGTYWYHAHAGLQEQQGLYGAIIIDPIKKSTIHSNKDYVVVLSDWSNTPPDRILANLKKSGDYYSLKFPLQPSLMRFIHDYKRANREERALIIDDYKMMQQMRMSLYDISDVAYDAFLLNGRTKYQPWVAPVKVGDVVRLRFIGAGASTIFHVKIPSTTMQVVQVQGNDVVPYTVSEFKIAPGETYDVLVNIRDARPSIIYAESIDTLGAAYGALISDPRPVVDYLAVQPFPTPLPVMRDMMSLMMNGGGASSPMDPMAHMDHMSDMGHTHNMNMPTEPSVSGDTLSSPESARTTIGTKYQDLKANVKTNDPNKPIDKTIKMELFGYMDRYIWFVNGVPEYAAKPIVLKPNKRYRFVFTNPSMMRHPMHIHGHWFILRNGHGRYDPLLHTIDIPPGATVTADLDTDASGQWLFHCHLLYHMMSGMSRVFQYDTLIELVHGKIQPEDEIRQTRFHNRPIVRVDELRPIAPSLVHHPMAHVMGFYMANMLEVGEDPVHQVQKINFKGLYGRDYNKLELFMNDAEVKKGVVDNADIDIFYWHLLNQFWSVKAGINYFYRPAQSPYWQPGLALEGLMPYFIETDIRGYFRSGSVKLDVELSRDSQITNNFFIRAGVRSILATKTVTPSQIGAGLNQMRYIVRPYYRLLPGLNVFAEYEHEQSFGPLRHIQASTGQGSVQNTVVAGFSALF